MEQTEDQRNRVKGLDLIARVPDELWTAVCDIAKETGTKKKNYKKAKWHSEEALQIAIKKRSERQRRKGKI